jgi:probable HAF family extracellular repeat protein
MAGYAESASGWIYFSDGWHDITGGCTHAVILNWSPGTVNGDGELLATDLGTLGWDFSWATGINDDGQVVGYSYGQLPFTPDNATHAFIYANHTMYDLNMLLPVNSGWILTQANAINNFGQIVGQGIINGQNHAFLFAPKIPAPAPRAAPHVPEQPRHRTTAAAE